MTAVIYRRRRLGLTSCRGIVEAMEEPCTYAREDQTDRWPDDTDLVIRWGCTNNIPVDCRNVLNRARAIHRVNDKSGFREILDDEELCPITWLGGRDDPVELPVVVRPKHHAQGRHLYIVNTPEELEDAIHRCGPGWYASEIIEKVAEYRIFIAQGRAVWVASKTPGNPEDVAWNVSRGGRFDNVRWGQWPLRVIKTAIKAFNLSELDFGGVDVIVDEEGTPYVIEINSAPSQTSEYRQRCTAQALDYIIRNGKDRIPLIEERGGWRKFISPALSEEAQIP